MNEQEEVMFEPMHPAAILSYAETLAKAIEYTNSREESAALKEHVIKQLLKPCIAVVYV